MISGVVIVDLPASLSVMQALKQFSGEPMLLLLDSAGRARHRDARYSFLTADPVAVETLDRAAYGTDPFAVLRSWQQLLPNVPDSVPPFCGGIAGLMSYELGEAFERLVRPAIDEFQTPALLAGLFDWCIVWDHMEESVRAYVLTLNGNPCELPAAACVPDPQQRQEQRLIWLRARLGGDVKLPAAGSAEQPGCSQEPTRRSEVSGSADRPETTGAEGPADGSVYLAGNPYPAEAGPEVRSNFTPQQYLATVDRIVDYIRAGDIFQANLSQRLSARWPADPVELYGRLRERNPAPFCACLITPRFSVISASPERFLRVSHGRYVETRPIKGTRRRQQLPIADLFTSEELSTSEKDRAENVMIVDLLRNDLSRNCRPGSVKVTGLCEIELFETVQHLVSTVVGELAEGCDIWNLCAGCFPGGSITGAPKIRAMQIIAELEPTVRGAYCGSIFYAGPQGHFDSSILIRTFTWKDGIVQFPVGGGIVADSNARDEYQETLHKASGMLRVLAHGPVPSPLRFD